MGRVKLSDSELRLLISLLVLFNAIPIVGGVIVLTTTFVVNFGVALIFQLTATVVCLTVVVPTVLVCSSIAVALFLLIRVAASYVDIALPRETEEPPPKSPLHQPIKLD